MMASRVLRPSMRKSALRVHSSRPFYRHPRRTYATNPAPSTRKQPQTRTGIFYKSFGSPILKTFLGALFTYQLAYWAWMRLENLEERQRLDENVEDLKQELKELLLQKREAERLLAEQEARNGKTDEVKNEEGKGKRGWLW